MSRPLTEAEERVVREAVARMRAGIMAVVFGIVGGTGLFLATAWLLVRGGADVGSTLSLLRHYFPGYSVTWSGSLVGFLYGAAVGALTGWATARVYNRIAALGGRSEEDA